MINYNRGCWLWYLRKYIEVFWVLGIFGFVEFLGESLEKKNKFKVLINLILYSFEN